MEKFIPPQSTIVPSLVEYNFPPKKYFEKWNYL